MESFLLVVMLCGIMVVFANIFQIKLRKKKLINVKSNTLFERISLPLQNTLIKTPLKKHVVIDKDELLINTAITLIEENFSNPYFNGEQLAIMLNISQRNLQRKFKLIKQSSPSKLIKNHRLIFAISQLNYGKTIKSVVFESGFSSQSYFNKCFKVQFCCTPSEYLLRQNNFDETCR